MAGMCRVMCSEDGQQLNEEEYIESFPLGFRFKPTDEELVQSYLMRKIKNLKLPCNRIREVDLYKFPTPQNLIENYALIKNRQSEWYFFTPRTKKYLNGDRPNRITPGGYWKSTGGDAPVCSRGQTTGKRRTLCFYEGKPTSARKTNWIMHEFRINEQGHSTSSNDSMKLNDWVLCKVFERNVGSNATAQRATAEVPNDANQQSLEQQQILQNQEYLPEVVHSGMVVLDNVAGQHNAIQQQEPPQQNEVLSHDLDSERFMQALNDIDFHLMESNRIDW